MKKREQEKTPLFDALVQFAHANPISFHVPGHKNGKVFVPEGLPFFKDILKIDQTELTGLDDLHAAEGVIKEAQQLAAEYFHADKTFFLTGGTTAGNLAMVLAVCGPDDEVIVQRNSHKSILNALELSGARPVFISSVFDETVQRYSSPDLNSITEAIEKYPHAKGLILTYPDYFGKTYPIREVIDQAHSYSIPVLIDEAHGVHFSSSDRFPLSSLDAGADIVVHSAHKMAPAMTMASFLHINSDSISHRRVAHYLQMIQSSSPSYPLMASLDLARAYLSALTEEKVTEVLESADWVRKELNKSDQLQTLFPTEYDDPLKITIVAEKGIDISKVATLFEKEGIHPELVTDSQLLLIHGLEPFNERRAFCSKLEKIQEQLKNFPKHATIDDRRIPQTSIQRLAFSYQEMRNIPSSFCSWPEAAGKAAAEPVIPYPPGIPLISKGEWITEEIASRVMKMASQGMNFQNNHIKQGIEVFNPDWTKGE